MLKLAVVGATGLVGETVLRVLEERQLPITTLLPVASARSAGQQLQWDRQAHTIMTLEEALAQKPDVAIFATDKDVSQEWVPQFVAVGTTVIDHSTVWRMDPACKLVVPEINGHLLSTADKIIANPNCSTIQLVMAMAPLHQRYGLRRMVVATYQAVTGSGRAGVEQLMTEREGGIAAAPAYAHAIDLNVIPQVDKFLASGYTKEEIKVVNETRKILDDSTIGLSVTAVRVPVVGGHSLAVNATFAEEFDLQEVVQLLESTPGVVVQDNIAEGVYPMPQHAHQHDEVFVGRLRRDSSQPHTLDLWIVADNLRKGAATNAVQIVERVCKLLV